MGLVYNNQANIHNNMLMRQQQQMQQLMNMQHHMMNRKQPGSANGTITGFTPEGQPLEIPQL